MNQEIVINEITSLERKLSLLINQHQQLKSKLQQLEIENNELKLTVVRKEEQVAQFQNKLKIGKLVSNVKADKSESAELKKKLDDYIKEIDKCIVHLTN
jgi:uncharacterized protein (DUF3084 family)